MMYITYRTHYGKIHSPTDSDPTTYSGIAFFTVELAALRHANQHGLKVVEIYAGETIDQAIRNSGAR